MQAVVSGLDDSSRKTVELLWEGMADEFGVQLPYRQPVAHFTWHISARYDWGRLRDVLFHASRDHGPFKAHASGLGLFTGRKPVLHVPLVRSSALNRLQRQLWTDLDGVGEDPGAYFHPERWVPHITLAHHGLTAEILPDLVRWLAARSFAWEIDVDHIGVIEDGRRRPEEIDSPTDTPDVAHRFELSGPLQSP